MTEFVELIKGGSVATILAVALWVTLVGAFREWWVPGPVLQRTLKERDAAIAQRDQAHRRADALLRLLYRSQDVNDAAIGAVLDTTETRQ